MAAAAEQACSQRPSPAAKVWLTLPWTRFKITQLRTHQASIIMCPIRTCARIRSCTAQSSNSSIFKGPRLPRLSRTVSVATLAAFYLAIKTGSISKLHHSSRWELMESLWWCHSRISRSMWEISMTKKESSLKENLILLIFCDEEIHAS